MFRSTLIIPCGILCTLSAFAKINQVRVINETTRPIYIHLGGFAASQKIQPGKWKIFHYPFTVTPPGSAASTKVSLITATAGGRWTTSPDGITTLNNPAMELCVDYNSPDLIDKSGNRKWAIKQIGGFDQNCHVKSYKQPWAQQPLKDDQS